jgi:hypothetical protein
MALYYRIVKTNPPTERDFLTDRQGGRRMPRRPLSHLWDTRSMYDTEAGARAMAQQFPALGSFISAVDIPEDGPMHAERTTRSDGHFSIWGDAAVLLDHVVSTVAV